MSSQTHSLRRLAISGLLKCLPRAFRDKLAVHLGKPDLRFSFLQLRRFGFAPRQALDVGAYRGDWTRICLEVWPEISVLCIEPQQSLQAQLNRFARENAPRILVKSCLLGASDIAAVPFAEVGTGSSVLDSKLAASTRPMFRIDSLVDDKNVPPPDFVKLDVQGYELEVLAGYEKHLRTCEVLQVELGLLPIVSGAALIHEVVAYLKERGFVMFDVDELIRAPSDGAVWQIDALFCREDSPLRYQRDWR